MEMLFGEAKDICNTCDCGAADGLFIDPSAGDAFYYKIVVDNIDDLKIMDTCGRKVIVDISNLDALIAGLLAIQNTVGEDIKDFNEISKSLRGAGIAVY